MKQMQQLKYSQRVLSYFFSQVLKQRKSLHMLYLSNLHAQNSQTVIMHNCVQSWAVRRVLCI